MTETNSITELVAKLREEHQSAEPYGRPRYCWKCANRWPCPVIQLCDQFELVVKDSSKRIAELMTHQCYDQIPAEFRGG